MWAKLSKYKNTALLLMRVGLGIMFMFHGYPKLVGGMEKWEKLGSSMSVLGIHFYPVAWGFMAAITEFIGGIFLIIGFVFRPVCLLMIFTMIVAALKHLNSGDSVLESSQPIELAIVFLGLLFLGAGKYSVDKK